MRSSDDDASRAGIPQASARGSESAWATAGQLGDAPRLRALRRVIRVRVHRAPVVEDAHEDEVRSISLRYPEVRPNGLHRRLPAVPLKASVVRVRDAGCRVRERSALPRARFTVLHFYGDRRKRLRGTTFEGNLRRGAAEVLHVVRTPEAACRARDGGQSRGKEQTMWSYTLDS